MPKGAFSDDFKSPTATRFPRLKLGQGDKKRVAVIEPDPYFEWVHRLQKPQVINGVVQKETKKRKDQTEYETYVYDFVSNTICMGDPDIVREAGVDRKNCVLCKASIEEGGIIAAPQRRWGLNLFVYATKPGTFDVSSPFRGEIVVWSFTDERMDKLIEIKNTWGDLRKHDLLLGPCNNPTYQRFDVNVAPEAVWLASKSNQSIAVETYKEGRCTDMASVIGRKSELRWIETDMQTVREAWNTVRSIEGGHTPDTGVAASLDSGLDALDGIAATLEAAPDSPSIETTTDDLDVAGLLDPEPSSDGPIPTESVETSDDVVDFTDLLSGLDQ